MELNESDLVKKAILDSQEKTRDYMKYAQSVGSEELQAYFKTFAEEEARQAQQLQECLKQMK